MNRIIIEQVMNSDILCNIYNKFSMACTKYLFHTQNVVFTDFWRYCVLFIFLLPSLCTSCYSYELQLKCQAVPEQVWGIQMVEASGSGEIVRIKLARLSDLHTDRLYHHTIFLVLISVISKVHTGSITWFEG